MSLFNFPDKNKYIDHFLGPRNQSLTTPHSLFNELHKKFHFTLDGCASPENALLPHFSSWQNPQPWEHERVFCNPPWSNIPPFIEKACTADIALLLVPARTNSRWFHRALALGARPEFFLGKPRFGRTKSNSPIDCLFLVFESR